MSRFVSWFQSLTQAVLTNSLLPVLNVTETSMDVLRLYSYLGIDVSISTDLSVSALEESRDEEYLELRYFMKG